MAEEKKPEVAGELPPPGTYINFVRIMHTQDEFTFEVGQFLQEVKVVQLSGRFISSPTHTKRLLETLRSSVQKYEQAFGKILETPSEPMGGKPGVS